MEKIVAASIAIVMYLGVRAFSRGDRLAARLSQKATDLARINSNLQTRIKEDE